MIYRKNLYSWEQMLRVAAGLGIVLYGLLGLPGQMLGYGLAAVGATFAMTGLFGYCPMCAVAGRRLKTDPAAP